MKNLTIREKAKLLFSSKEYRREVEISDMNEEDGVQFLIDTLNESDIDEMIKEVGIVSLERVGQKRHQYICPITNMRSLLDGVHNEGEEFTCFRCNKNHTITFKKEENEKSNKISS